MYNLNLFRNVIWKSYSKNCAKCSDDIKVKETVQQEGKTQVIPENRVTQMNVGNSRDKDMKLYSDND